MEIINSLGSLVFFASWCYLLIRLDLHKKKWRILASAVEWASKASLRIVETDKIKYQCWKRGPDKIWFLATNDMNQVFEICLELRITSVQHVADILRKWDANFETKLISKTPTESLASLA